MADVTPRPYNSVEIRTAIVAAQDKAATIPLDNYDTVTVNSRLLGFGPSDHDSAVDIMPFKPSSVVEMPGIAPTSADAVETDEPPIEIPFFEFSEFNEDLTLSPTSSATPSLSSEPIRADSPSSVASAEPPASASTVSPERKSREASPPRLTPARSATLLRGSWPLVKYVGRGTPIDPTRRSQWGGFLASEEVGEDGVLYSTTVRSASLDSQSYPRSISPDWNLVSKGSPQPLQLTMGENRFDGPVTDHLGITDRLQASPKEWSDFMQGLLESTAKELASKPADSSAPEASTSALPMDVDSSSTPSSPEGEETIVEVDQNSPNDTPETQTARQSEEEHDIKVDLGSDTALDLSLSVGPGFNPFQVPDYHDESGRAMSPSVYSTAPPTPCASRPPSQASQSQASRQSRHSRLSVESTTSAVSRYSEKKPSRPPWWRKFNFVRKVGHMQRLSRMLRSINH